MSTNRSVRQYSRWLLIALGGLLLLHLAVIAGLLPADMVWGGQYPAGPQLVKMEILASVITIFFGLIVANYGELLRIFPGSLSKIGMYLLVGLFLLSVLGSATSAHPIEKYGLSFYSFVLVVLSVQLLRAKAKPST